MYFANCIGGSRILNNGSEIPMIGLGIARIEGQVMRYPHPNVRKNSCQVSIILRTYQLITITYNNTSIVQSIGIIDFVEEVIIPIIISYVYGYRHMFLGCLTIECIDVAVHSALSAGYRLFDTAELYGNEKELGVALSKYLPVFGLERKDIFITTKVQTKDGDVAEWVETSIQKSLENLSTTYLDMVLVHFPRDRYTGEDEAYEKNKYGRRVVWQKLEEIKGTPLFIIIIINIYIIRF
uniref:Aldo_ket_red domain-containing protein n=1 Tax=Heterorhabditis bacteriophora TaxID=37862 RepID=A0A1I7X661_HETBA